MNKLTGKILNKYCCGSSLFQTLNPSAASFRFGLILLFAGLLSWTTFAQTQTDPGNSGCFELSVSGNPAPLFISAEDYPGAVRAMQDFQSDVERVTQTKPALLTDSLTGNQKMIIAGTIGKSEVIDQLIERGKIDASEIEGKWESYLQEVVENPSEGIEQALVVAGSDMRGTIFGIYDLSKEIGVSPWYWWADVPVQQKESLSVLPGCRSVEQPKVQYRGIFINDENPALFGWVNENYGGFNHEFYSEVFELILRLKGNYLWPAMWGKAFYDDDSLNAPTAEKYGVVIGTTHHEPMARSHVEWERYGEGAWNYQTNEDTLKQFWTKGIKRLGSHESSITLGMRGDGDMAMSEETNIEMLERIVADQREIIEEHSEQDPEKELQLWALYKEVQEYYEKGMRVPDDVMLLLAEDNWGNVRLLPRPETADDHPGGWGMYYHFDYVGGPRNYKWINTNQISRVWEQMHLTYEHGVDKMWLVNVGDLKPMEFPISFFLDFAWNPDAMTAGDMNAYPGKWATYQFGEKYGKEIGNILTTYTKYNARRKPELLSPDTYSLVHFNEADRIVNNYIKLAEKAERIYNDLPGEYKAAYYQLVLFPVKASANLNELYVTAAKNKWYAGQGRAKTNELAAKAWQLFEKDAELTEYFHTEMADGKWNHMMSQTHIGYTYWQQPEQNNMPEVDSISVPETAEMGVSIPGSKDWWPNSSAPAILPAFDRFNDQSYEIELFNRGTQSYSYSVDAGAQWLSISEAEGTVDQQKTINVSVDWNKAPKGKLNAYLTIRSDKGNAVAILTTTHNPVAPEKDSLRGFVESNGYVSIEAPHYSRVVNNDSVSWVNIPQLGRTLSSMTPMPVTAEPQVPGKETTPRLEYDIHVFGPGEVKVKVFMAPTLNYYMKSDGFKYGVSFNDEEPQLVNIHKDNNWYELVANNINVKESTHYIKEPGKHTLKLWMGNPGVVIQKIVVETGDVGTSYLGPPESYHTLE